MDPVRSGRPGENQQALEDNWPFNPPQREWNKNMGCKGGKKGGKKGKGK